MHINKRRIWFWFAILVAALVGWLASEYGIVPIPHSQAPVARHVKLTAYQQPNQPNQCLTTEGVPCDWLAHGVQHAYHDGALGPKRVTVPASVRRRVRHAVFARGRRFTRRVRNDLPWFENDVWTFNCVMSAAERQAFGQYYPRCESRRQIKNSFSTIHKITLGCGETALVTGIAGRVVPKSDAGEIGMWASLAGYVGCAANTVMHYVKDQAHLVRGYRSAVPGSHRPRY